MTKKIPIDSYVTWNSVTNKFYRYTKFSNGSIMGEPITEEEYLKEKGF
jgi:hypothetical protein